METHQIIILSILGVFWILSYFKIGLNLDKFIQTKNKAFVKSFYLWFFIHCILNAMVITGLLITIIINNDLAKQLEAKFPKLEQVHDVYKIVEE